MDSVEEAREMIRNASAADLKAVQAQLDGELHLVRTKTASIMRELSTRVSPEEGLGSLPSLMGQFTLGKDPSMAPGSLENKEDLQVTLAQLLDQLKAVEAKQIACRDRMAELHREQARKANQAAEQGLIPANPGSGAVSLLAPAHGNFGELEVSSWSSLEDLENAHAIVTAKLQQLQSQAVKIAAQQAEDKSADGPSPAIGNIIEELKAVERKQKAIQGAMDSYQQRNVIAARTGVPPSAEPEHLWLEPAPPAQKPIVPSGGLTSFKVAGDLMDQDFTDGKLGLKPRVAESVFYDRDPAHEAMQENDW